MKTLFLLVVAAAIGAFAFIGCAKDQTENVQSQVTRGAANAWDKTKAGLSSAGKTISKTADQVEETAKIKGPIDATKDIDSSKMSVTTIDKTVFLAGSVPTADEKTRVEQMVHANIDKGFKLEDNLKVVAAPKVENKQAPKADDSSPQ